MADYLKHKSWDVECPLSDQQIAGNEIDFIVQKFRLMKPLNDFLNEALQDFVMPQR